MGTLRRLPRSWHHNNSSRRDTIAEISQERKTSQLINQLKSDKLALNFMHD